jgi:hypothetical protein
MEDKRSRHLLSYPRRGHDRAGRGKELGRPAASPNLHQRPNNKRRACAARSDLAARSLLCRVREGPLRILPAAYKSWFFLTLTGTFNSHLLRVLLFLDPTFGWRGASYSSLYEVCLKVISSSP